MSEFIFPAVFALRLPRSTRRQAHEMAKQEGLSVNQFITLAVAEKIVRLEAREFESSLLSDAQDESDGPEKLPAS